MTPETDAGLWSTNSGSEVAIPVARPRLPSADAILPYLRRIDTNRWYSNGGPLVREFEIQLGIQAGAVETVSVANATLGLALSLMAQDPAPGSLCMIPAWSFAASAHAAQLAGLVPWLVDVDPASWSLAPATAADLLQAAPATVGAVMPVQPFGSPMDLVAWDTFRKKTGIAVVIDAAAAFDTVKAAAVPAVVSLHATKVLGIGEGGFVASCDVALLNDIRQRCNFGFWYSREATVTALNGKLSEYAAAVGLASLDGWPQARSAFARIAQAYRRGFADTPEICCQAGFGESWVSSTVIVTLPTGTLPNVVSALADAGISSRRWWGGGLHRHAAFRTCPRIPVPVTNSLVESTIGLPCWPELRQTEIARITAIVRGAC